MVFPVVFIFFLILLAPAVAKRFGWLKGPRGKSAVLIQIAVLFTFCLIVISTSIGQAAYAAEADSASALQDSSKSIGLFSAALSTGLSCIAAGIAVAAAASAALGAISENDKIFGKALIFVALAEGVALYGLLVSFQILAKV
ncbi:MAG: ATP synthase subunit C [Clostridiales bacterium]|nr:ATP synthase subunit C [Clostridiales bacterium]